MLTWLACALRNSQRKSLQRAALVEGIVILRVPENYHVWPRCLPELSWQVLACRLNLQALCATNWQETEYRMHEAGLSLKFALSSGHSLKYVLRILIAELARCRHIRRWSGLLGSAAFKKQKCTEFFIHARACFEWLMNCAHQRSGILPNTGTSPTWLGMCVGTSVMGGICWYHQPCIILPVEAFTAHPTGSIMSGWTRSIFLRLQKEMQFFIQPQDR